MKCKISIFYTKKRISLNTCRLFLISKISYILSNSLNIYFNKNILQNNKNSFSTFIENLNPNYVTGFCDGEACFSVHIYSYVKLKIGWKINLAFSIHLHKRDIKLLEKIQIFFGLHWLCHSTG